VEALPSSAVWRPCPVVAVVEDFHVVVVERPCPSAVGEDFHVVVVEGGLGGRRGGWTTAPSMVVDDDGAAVAWACVTWMLRWPRWSRVAVVATS